MAVLRRDNLVMPTQRRERLRPDSTISPLLVVVRSVIPALLMALSTVATSGAQELEPRRWGHLPANANIHGIGYAFIDGDLSFDPVLQIDDATVELHTVGLKYIRTLDLFGFSARLDVAGAYQEGTWKGLLEGVPCNQNERLKEHSGDEIMKVEQDGDEAAVEKEEPRTVGTSRRDFLKQGGLGMASFAGVAATLGSQAGPASAAAHRSGKRRVTILFDSWNHMMPALAREMVRRNHDLVLGDARDEELVKELRKLGAKVEVVPDTADQAKPETFQKLVDRAQEAFGGFDSACVRTGTHVNASVLNAKDRDLDTVYDGNIKSVFYALRALLPPLVAQKSGQVVINTSAGALRPQPEVALYCATRAAANALVRAGALEVASHGVTLNATGTYGMAYPSFLHMVGADKDPAKRKAVADAMPIERLIEPEDAASFVATLIDGTATGQTAQFFPIDGGWGFM
jgi:NAD(P)-dependent dehydrogenase (short-subunit alcohol dehydrogenase family)